MELRMKNFNILGVHRKIKFLKGIGGGGDVHEKTIQKGDCLRGIYRFKGKGAWQEREGLCFGGGEVTTPMHTVYHDVLS